MNPDPPLKGWERLALLVTTCLPEPSTNAPLVGAEIGVSQGWTSEHLLREFPTLEMLYMVDFWETTDPNSVYAKSGDGHARLSTAEQSAHYQKARNRTEFASARRLMIPLDSVDAASSPYLMNAQDSLAFVFIDGDHTYQGVKRDLEAWWPKIKPGGLLIGHDFSHPRDKRGLWGVTKAASEFCLQHALKFHGDARANVWWCEKP